MGRLIGAVVAGYLVMAVAVFSLFSLAYLALGADAAFEPGSWEVSGLWIVISIVLGFGAAVAGGWIAAMIARQPNGPRALAAFVLILGMALAIPATRPPVETAARPAEVPNMAAMRQARTPPWMAWLNPLIGAIGVLVGGRLRLSRRPPPAEAAPAPGRTTP